MNDNNSTSRAPINIDVLQFRHRLLDWGQYHFRAFPWRQTQDAYQILIAELLLHRTQASQVVPVYKNLLQWYPDVDALAQANKEKLHQLLFSVGLRWRIDLLPEMAKLLVTQFDGQVPQDRTELLELPGVSDYIANAVRCFAWNIAEPVIDTNVVRVISRLAGIEVRDSLRRNSAFRQRVAALVDPEKPRSYTFALLDLAAQICTTKLPPACSRCPVQVYCVYGHKTMTGSKEKDLCI